MQVFRPNKVQGVRVVQLNNLTLPLLAPWGELYQIMMLCPQTSTPHGAIIARVHVYTHYIATACDTTCMQP